MSRLRSVDALSVLAWPAWANRSFNPYNARLATQLVQDGVDVREFRLDRAVAANFDVLHMHWPDVLLGHDSRVVARVKSRALLTLLDAVRVRGAAVVWTAHNLEGHERLHADLRPRFWRELTERIDGVIALTSNGLEAVHDRFPVLAHKPGHVVPHGHYRDDYPSGMTRAEARDRLKLPHEAPVLLFYGRIREYKGVPELISLVREMPSDVLLHVAGLPGSSDLENRVRAASDQDHRVSLDLSLLSAAATEVAFAAADLVVLPYRENFNSGTAMLALSFNRPALLPARGAVLELQASVGDLWIRTFEGTLTAETVHAAVAWAVGADRGSSAPLAAFDWPTVARGTVNAYREIVATPRTRR